MAQKKIAVLVGSFRKESFNRKMAKALIKLAPDSLGLEIIKRSEGSRSTIRPLPQGNCNAISIRLYSIGRDLTAAYGK